MNIRAWSVAGLAVLCFGAPPAFGDDAPLAAALRQAVEGNVAAYDRRDVDGTMRFIDTKSPDYESTKAALADQFKDLDATSTLVGFDYIGHDNEFAVARVKLKTTGKPGTGFTDNTVDAIVLFHQENGAWKLWGEEILGVQMAQ